MDWDIIVVGAGPAGLTVSRLLAKEGFSVLLIDKLPRERIGEKVCGDGISAGYFDLLGLEHPRGKELSAIIRKSVIFSPSWRFMIEVSGLGYTIDRLHFGQRLLRLAEKNGVNVWDKTIALRPKISDGVVKGVVLRRNGKEQTLSARLVIDASGVSAVLRNKLPQGMLLEIKLSKFDISAAYRIIAELEEPIVEEDAIYIYLNHSYAPGGYTWIFSKGKNTVNLGLGVQPIHPNSDNPKKLLNKLIKDKKIKIRKIIHQAGGIVPTRRPLPMIVTNGLLLVGDSAAQANPLHGGGIGHAMHAASIAARHISKYSDTDGIFTKNKLWGYALEWMRGEGANMAGLDVVRIGLQGMSNDDLEFIIKHSIISGDELVDLQNEEKGFQVLGKVIKLVKLLKKPNLLRKLVRIRKYYEDIRSHYGNYPETPKNIYSWYKHEKEITTKIIRDLWSP